MTENTPERGSFEDAVAKHPASQYDISDSLDFYSTAIRSHKPNLREIFRDISSEDVKILLAATAFSLTVVSSPIIAEETFEVLGSIGDYLSDRFQSMSQPFYEIR